MRVWPKFVLSASVWCGKACVEMRDHAYLQLVAGLLQLCHTVCELLYLFTAGVLEIVVAGLKVVELGGGVLKLDSELLFLKLRAGQGGARTKCPQLLRLGYRFPRCCRLP